MLRQLKNGLEKNLDYKKNKEKFLIVIKAVGETYRELGDPVF